MSRVLANITVESDIFQKVTATIQDAKELQTPVPPDNKEDDLQITDYYLPSLYPGKYEFTIKQDISFDGTNDNFAASFVAEVKAPLQPLDVSSIYHHYPAKSAMGDYSEVLPHVVLKQKGLPWQLKNAYSNEVGVSWLALVLMTEDEMDANTKPGQPVKIPKSLIPKPENLRYLAHIARTADGNERSVLISQRLATPEKNNIAHIIALHEEPTDTGDEAYGHYTSLFSWNFTCEAEQNSFQSIMMNLDCDLLRLPALKLPSDYEQMPANEKNKLKKKLNNYNKCIEQGYVPLPHLARNGQRIMSWYRSPLTPYDVDTEFDIRYINHSDHLLRYFQKSKRLDTTYSIAWELGKWLTLQQKEVAEALYIWKKNYSMYKKRAIRRTQQNAESNGSELTATEETIATVVKYLSDNGLDTPMPLQVYDWLLDLVRLKPLPFCNIVPDDQMLPEESLRFFHVDEGWIWAMIDGALSIGRMPTEKPNDPIKIPELYLTGCLMRSEAVKMFPDFNVTANGKTLPVDRRKIGEDLMICLFHSQQPIKTLEVFLQSGDTHFGIDKKKMEEGKPIEYTKKFFTLPGEKKFENFPVPLNYENRIINVKDFAGKMGASGKQKSSRFSLSMLEMTPKVIFKGSDDK